MSEPEPLGSGCGGEQGDDAAVRVPDEVVAGLEEVGNEPRVRLEVDSCHRRVRREAGTVEHDELEPLGKWPLRRPGRAAVHDAPVDEHDPLHRTIVTPCNEVDSISFNQARSCCYKHADMLRPG